ncbi:MAG: hypothetical protein ACOX4L_07540 [Bacillota bacterium]
MSDSRNNNYKPVQEKFKYEFIQEIGTSANILDQNEKDIQNTKKQKKK